MYPVYQVPENHKRIAGLSGSYQMYNGPEIYYKQNDKKGHPNEIR